MGGWRDKVSARASRAKRRTEKLAALGRFGHEALEVQMRVLQRVLELLEVAVERLDLVISLFRKQTRRLNQGILDRFLRANKIQRLRDLGLLRLVVLALHATHMEKKNCAKIEITSATQSERALLCNVRSTGGFPPLAPRSRP